MRIKARSFWLSDEGLVALGAVQQSNSLPSLRVLSPAQYATLEALDDSGAVNSGLRSGRC